MVEIILTVINLALLGYLVYEKRESSKERKSLINAVIAKNAQEKKDLDWNDKVAPEAEDKVESDFIPLDTMSTEEWEKKIIGIDQNDGSN